MPTSDLPVPRDVFARVLDFCQLPAVCVLAQVNVAHLDVCARHVQTAHSVDFRPRARWSAQLVCALLQCALGDRRSPWLRVLDARRSQPHLSVRADAGRAIRQVHFGWYCALTPPLNIDAHFNDRETLSSAESPNLVQAARAAEAHHTLELLIISLVARLPAVNSLTLGPALAHVLDDSVLECALLHNGLGARLEHLNIEGCVRLSAAFLDARLSALCPHLRSLNVAGTATVHGGAVTSSLTDLDASLAHCTSELVERIERARAPLRRLVLVDPDLQLPRLDLDEHINAWLARAARDDDAPTAAAVAVDDDCVTRMPSASHLGALQLLRHELAAEADDGDFENTFELAAQVHQRACTLHTAVHSKGVVLVPSSALAAFPLAHLRFVSLNDQQLFGDVSLLALLALIGPQLEHVELENTAVGEVGMCAIGDVCTRLRVLNLGRLDISERALVAIARGCGAQLTDLVAFFATSIETRGVDALAQHCVALMHLNVRSCAADSSTLARLIVALPALVHIDLCGTAFCPLDVVALLHDTQRLSLESLLLTETCTSDASLAALVRHTPRLRRLDVYQCDGVSDVGLCAVFTSCAQLHVLWCGGGTGPITDRAFIALAAAPCRRVFEELHICNELYECGDNNSAAELDYRSLPCAAFGTPAAAALRAQVLSELCSPEAAARLDVGDDGLAALAAHCLRLRVLDVTGLSRVSDATLDALAQHAHHTLTSVTVDFCASISLCGVQRLLISCAQLRHVSLFGCAGLEAGAGAALQRTLRCTISGQRLLCVRADVPEASGACTVWPCAASWHAQWTSPEAKHLVLSGRRSFGWDLSEEANYDRCCL